MKEIDESTALHREATRTTWDAIVIGAGLLVPAIMFGLARVARPMLRRRFGVEGLLALRCGHHHGTAGGGEAAADFLEGKAFARAGAAAEERDEIAARQNLPYGAVLFRREFARRRTLRGWTEQADPSLRS